jgi:hypothetical protein
MIANEVPFFKSVPYAQNKADLASLDDLLHQSFMISTHFDFNLIENSRPEW